MLLWRAHPSAAHMVWMAAAVVTVLSLLSTTVARWMFVGLSYGTYPIGFLTSWMTLATLFYLVLVPIALFLRLAGRDVLRLKPRAPVESQWVERKGRGSEATRAFRQF